MKVVAIIQARMGSTRLPGKVLRLLAGKTVLAQVIRRARAITGVDQVVVATSTRSDDDRVEQEATLNGAEVYRGSESDVLDRYHSAAVKVKAEVVIRITSDCPLLDSIVVGAMLKRFLAANASDEAIDYMSNGLRRTFPRGLDAEIFTREALNRAHQGARQPYEREHVTPYIYQHPESFHIHSFESDKDLSHLRWTLDTEQDLQMLTRVFQGLQSSTDTPSTVEVLEFLRLNPEVATINAEVRQKALE